MDGTAWRDSKSITAKDFEAEVSVEGWVQETRA